MKLSFWKTVQTEPVNSHHLNENSKEKGKKDLKNKSNLSHFNCMFHKAVSVRKDIIDSNFQK